MTKQLIKSYVAFLSMAVILAIAGATTALASEVTGTLSSDTSGKTLTGGNISGTVSDGEETTGSLEGTVSDDSSGGGSSSGGRRNTDDDDTPSATVLGEATSVTDTPGFPNAGVAPEKNQADQSLWHRVANMLRNILSF